jgi:hypothetical protein
MTGNHVLVQSDQGLAFNHTEKIEVWISVVGNFE